MTASNSYVYFGLKGDNFNPDHITSALQILPTEIRRKGEAIGNSGNKIKFSAWYLYSDKTDNLFVNKLVEDVVERLFDKIDVINILKKEFHLTSILEIVLYIDENEEVSTPLIGHDLKTIEFLFRTNTETDVDIYKFNSIEMDAEQDGT
ncbi:MAG: DUF4279 domain-containing protein [Flavobacteriales bacterium]